MSKIITIIFTIIILIIIPSTLSAYNSTTEVKGFRIGECKAWTQFRKKFNKTYSSVREAKRRKMIFIKNYRLVTNHNKHYDLNLESFLCSINRFSDLTKEEFQQKYTGFQPPTDYNVTHEQGFGIKAVGTGIVVGNHKKIIQEGKVLKSIDWRRTAVTGVKKQGECGSCWTFSAAGALEGQIFIKARKLYEVSAQYFLDCVKTNITDGCTGGLMTDVYKFSMTNGIVEDARHPYTDGQSPDGCTIQDLTIPIKVTGYIELKKVSEDELLRAVSTIGPISIAIDARWQSLQFYETGVYFEPLCDPNELNHAVLVVGYGTDEDFGDYWTVKNSWGIGWGEYGYIRMARNKSNHCGVATMPSYPVVSVRF
ncbi:hypothetical protein ACKWTF_014302 [Chironomus riparius]